LSLPVVPTYLGFDPRIQVIHETDALAALVAAVHRPVRGPVNVAAPGTIGLTRMVRLAGRPTLPIPSPLFVNATEVGRRLGLVNFSPDFRRLLRYGRGADTTRLREEVGFAPRYTTLAAGAGRSAARDWPGGEPAAGGVDEGRAPAARRPPGAAAAVLGTRLGVGAPGRLGGEGRARGGACVAVEPDAPARAGRARRRLPR